MSKSIIWSLQNQCPPLWIEKFNQLNYKIYHSPIIKLVLNKKKSSLMEQVAKYDTIIITSPFSAKKIIEVLKCKYNILTVGIKAREILQEVGHNIIYTANNSNDLAYYISNNIHKSIMHPCSEQSNNELWPSNVVVYPFYKPIENYNFNISEIELSSKSLIVIGSPSAAKILFKKKYNLNNINIATMGRIFKDNLISHNLQKVITPQSSTTDSLCNSIYNYIKQTKYEKE